MSRHANLKNIVNGAYIGEQGYYDEIPEKDLYNYGDEEYNDEEYYD